MCTAQYDTNTIYTFGHYGINSGRKFSAATVGGGGRGEESVSLTAQGFLNHGDLVALIRLSKLFSGNNIIEQWLNGKYRTGH